MQRTDLALSREVAANGKPMLGSARTLRPPVLNMTGDRSPHVDATVALNGRLQPNKCTWMKLQGGLGSASNQLIISSLFRSTYRDPFKEWLF